MFVSFLHPVQAGGQEAPYLWVLYKQITHLRPGDVVFVGTNDYFRDPQSYLNAGRSDIQPWSQEYGGFRIPSSDELRRYRSELLSDDLFNVAPEARVEATRALLTERHPALEEALRPIIARLSSTNEIEAILTWCNVPSVSVIAAEFGIPVIHNELGPLRRPCFHRTAYFDFHGVNGGTEAEARFHAFRASPAAGVAAPLLSRTELRELLLLGSEPADDGEQPEFEIGLPLQVRNDTNIIAFAKGWTNDKLVEATSKLHSRDEILIRMHPAEPRRYPDRCGVIDDSPDSATFIRRCRRIVTINSSVGLEALLWGREASILGENPCAFAAGREIGGSSLNEADQLRALNFLLIGYLVPYEFLFDVGYYRWRLTRPDERAIHAFHFEYLQQRRELLAESLRFRSPQEPLVASGLLKFELLNDHELQLVLARKRDEIDRSVRDLKNSMSWRLTAPLRWIHQRLVSRS